MGTRLALVSSAGLGFFLIACWLPGAGIDYINATSQRVTVYEGEVKAFAIEPRESAGVAMAKRYWEPNIKVVAEDGRVLLEDHITWRELKEMNYRIVITDPGRP